MPMDIVDIKTAVIEDVQKAVETLTNMADQYLLDGNIAQAERITGKAATVKAVYAHFEHNIVTARSDQHMILVIALIADEATRHDDWDASGVALVIDYIARVL